MKDLTTIDYFKKLDLKYAFDNLTGILNREVITSYFAYLIETKTKFTICLCDVDNFKHINDTYGHMMGDEVIQTFAKAASDVIGDKGVIGRYGGDEFMILLPNICEYDEIWEICHSLNVTLSNLKFHSAPDLIVTVTNGISRFPLDGDTYAQLLQTADKALYRGKAKGRNCFIIYLAEKHKDIEIKGRKESLYNTMEMISRTFEIISTNRDLATDIQNLVQYLSTYLAIDSVSVESLTKKCAEYINPNCDFRDFKFIDTRLYDKEMNYFGLACINVRKTLLQTNSEELLDKLRESNTFSFVAVRIQDNGPHYGTIIAKSTNNRVWQPNEMDLLVVAAKIIARGLNFKNTSLDSIFKN